MVWAKIGTGDGGRGLGTGDGGRLRRGFSLALREPQLATPAHAPLSPGEGLGVRPGAQG